MTNVLRGQAAASSRKRSAAFSFLCAALVCVGMLVILSPLLLVAREAEQEPTFLYALPQTAPSAEHPAATQGDLVRPVEALPVIMDNGDAADVGIHTLEAAPGTAPETPGQK